MILLPAHIDAGIMFCGTPRQVVDQLIDFSEAVGGFGHLLAMAQAGTLSREETAETHLAGAGGDA